MLAMTDKARELYGKALDLFAEQKLIDAAGLLAQAVQEDPRFADAHEALGVIYARLDRVDEAIECMNRVLEIDPGSVMAHTNLSVFYMKKGMKEKAEEEKAKATVATFDQFGKKKNES